MLLDGEYREEKTRRWYEFVGGAKTRSQIRKRLILLAIVIVLGILKWMGILRF